ncbi:hypothetical protein Tco_0680236 [Tanacetum coccineum]|uniref:Uncharacterized protein n=1 Tax=Tanacetum coccineum TaxID=301880 RepID=A0ABQ4XK26_9ASTR
MQVDLTEYVEKHGFVFDAVINEDVTNDEVDILANRGARYPNYLPANQSDLLCLWANRNMVEGSHLQLVVYQVIEVEEAGSGGVVKKDDRHLNEAVGSRWKTNGKKGCVYNSGYGLINCIVGNPLICPAGYEEQCFGMTLMPISMPLNNTQHNVDVKLLVTDPAYYPKIPNIFLPINLLGSSLLHLSVIYKEQARLNQATSNSLMARLETHKAMPLGLFFKGVCTFGVPGCVLIKTGSGFRVRHLNLIKTRDLILQLAERLMLNALTDAGVKAVKISFIQKERICESCVSGEGDTVLRVIRSNY